MQLIGVIDLAAGRAVRAHAGRRETYRPVENFAGEPIDPGNALALARAYVERAGISELYVADLDAIAAALVDAPPDDRVGTDAAGRQDALVAAVAACAPLWLDAGVSSPDRARHAITLGAARVIVGLETLASYDRLKRTCDAVGGDRVAFSLDLRAGEPILASHGIPAGDPPQILAARAADMGAGAVIVLDLARVGTGAGLDLEVIERVRASTPGVTLLAGGGVRGLADLRRLADAGCDGALVATALQDGKIGVADVLAAYRYRSASR